LFVFVFILSLLAGIIMTVVSTILTVVAIVVAIVFLATVAGFKNYGINNEISSPGQYIVSLKNKSAVLFVAGLLVCGYNLLYVAGALPPFYRGNTPERYGRLVEQAVTREDTGLASEFKIRYDNFVRRHAE